MTNTDAKREPGLNRQIPALALPAIISNITVPLLGLCDTAVAGHLPEVAAIGAISVGSMMINVFCWLFGFLRMGTTGLVAQAYGARNRGRCLDILRKTLWAAVIGGIVVIVAQVPLWNALMALMRPDGDVQELTRQYYRICVWGVAPQLVIMTLTGWFIGLQNTRVPMWIAIGVNVVNVTLNVLLGLVLGYGVRGVAMGTTVSNWMGCVAAVVVCLNWVRGRNGVLRQLTEHRDGRVAWKELFGMNGYLFVRSACIMAVSLSMTAYSARMGAVSLAANAVMMQFFLLFSYFMDGFAFAGEGLVGKYHGAGNAGMMRRSVRALLKWGAWMAVIFFTVYALFTPQITGLLTDKSVVVEHVEHLKVFVMLLPPLTVLAFIFDGIYIGLGRTGVMMWSAIAGMALFYAITGVNGLKQDGTAVLWLAFEAYLVLRGVWLATFYAVDGKKMAKNS